MKNVRKSIAIVLAVLMLMTTVPFSSFAATPILKCSCGKNLIKDADEKPATCTEPETKKIYKCNKDKKRYINVYDDVVVEATAENIVIPALGHEPKGDMIPEVPAQCEKDGTKSHYICKNCDEKIIKDEDNKFVAVTDEDLKIEAPGHDYSEEVANETYKYQSGNCVKNAIFYKSCKCGASAENILDENATEEELAQYTFEGEKDPSNHDCKKIDAKSSSCTEAGNKEYYKCSNEGCNKIFSDPNGENENSIADVTLTLAAHDWTETEKYLKAEATCKADAVYYRECSACHASSEAIAPTETWTKENTKITTHDFDEYSYSFTVGYKMCNAIQTCKICDKKNVKVSADITSANKSDATCEKGSVITYTAKFDDGDVYTEDVENNDSLGHNYGAATYEWNDDNSACTAERVCLNDESHKETETATASSQEKTAANCTTKGTTTYTVTFKNPAFAAQTKDVQDIPTNSNHSYGTPTYKWNDDKSACTATMACTREGCTAEPVKETSTSSSQVTKAANCTVMGTTTYTAAFSNPAFATQTKDVQNIPTNSNHNYGTATYKWSADHSTCTAEKVCANNEEHKITEEATATSKVKTAASCVQNGTTTYSVAFENTDFEAQTDDVNNIPALGHTYGEATYTWAADKSTCTATMVCTREGCTQETEGNTVTETVKADVNTRKATCEEDGLSRYTATFENDAFEEQTESAVLPATGHNFTGEVVEAKYLASEANCKEKAKYYKSCVNENCGASSKDKEGEATFETGEINSENHFTKVEDAKWVPTFTNGTDCKAGGTKTKTCVCGQQLASETFSGHEYAHVYRTEPTCTEDGNEYGVICKLCTYCIGCKPIPATGHTEETVEAVAATCKEPGNTEGKRCSVCGVETVPITVIPAKGHVESSVDKIDATCTKDGNEAGSKCTVCGEYIFGGEVIPAKGHDPELVEGKEATCTEAGTLEYNKCKVCDILYTVSTDEEGNEVITVITEADIAIPVAEHEWDEETAEYENGKAPTCTEGAKGKFKCKNCDAETTLEKEALGHDWDEGTLVASTCTENGYTRFCCKREGCEEIKKVPNEEDYSSGHELREGWETIEEATCTTQGLKARYCNKCHDYVYPTIIDVKPHSFVDRIKDATCTENGVKCRVCIECNYKTEDEVIPALEHDFAVVSGSGATCTEDSTLVYECTVCGLTKEDKTAKSNHKDDNKDGKCDNCGEVTCDCICHKTDTLHVILYKIALFFWDLFRIRRVCDCGVEHYQIYHG